MILLVLDQFIVTIDNLRQYPNMLAFNIGNEVVTGVNNTNTLPFVKAAARDVKAYLRSVNSTALVGYASTDGAENSWRDATANYLTCGSDATSIDLYGLSAQGSSVLSLSTFSKARYVAQVSTTTVGAAIRPWPLQGTPS
jgi:Glucanosyltransferase